VRGASPSSPATAPIVTRESPALLPDRRPPAWASDRLPSPPTSFVGRERDLAEVRRLLGTSRLVTLVGLGGVGKTRLAIQVANELAAEYRDGVALVELSAIVEPSLITRVLAAALKHRDEGAGAVHSAGDRLLDTLAAALATRECLLVFDNCEHLLDAVAQVIDRLLRTCPRLYVLATSREPIAIDGEAIWRVSPLALSSGVGRQQTGQVSDAVALFLDRARAASPEFASTPDNIAAVERVCRDLDGIPLAIELAAARLRGLPLSAIVEGLTDRYDLLTVGSRVAPARHRTLRGLIDWSFELLTADERALFQCLAVFAGSFSLAAAEAVGRIGGRGIDLLPRLVEKSLVVLEQTDGQPRFRLLDTLRVYAGEKLREAGEEATTRQRFIAWYLQLVETGEAMLRTSVHDVWVARLAQEHDNLRRAISWSLADAAGDAGPRLVGSLAWFWEIRGHHVEAIGYLEWALAIVDGRRSAVPAGVRPKLLNGLGLLLFGCGSYRRAVAYAEEALELCRAADSDWGTCVALATLGYIAQFDGESDRATALLGEALTIAERHDDKLNMAHALYGLGIVEHGRGDYERASELYTRSLALWRGLGAATRCAQSLTLLARMVHLRGDDVRAAALLEESLAAGRAAGSPRAIGWSLLYLGHIMRARGDFARADLLYVESLDQRAVVGDRRGIAQCLEALAAVSTIRTARGPHGTAHQAAERRSDAVRAATLFGAAESIRESVSAFILPCERAGYARDVAALRGALGSALETHWKHGRDLALDSAVEAGRAIQRQAGSTLRAVLTAVDGGREPEPAVLLSRREREVLVLIARGLTSRQIADELSIAKRTADTHAENILNKLGLGTRREAAVWAVEHGLLPRADHLAVSARS
jgi:predicted ATPase/DNA-binding CsgD family transcriptional regulator